MGLYAMCDWRHGGHWKSLNFTTSTVAPSEATPRSTRGDVAMNPSNSDCCAWEGGGAAAGAAAASSGPLRGNNTRVATAPPKNNTVTRMAAGVAISRRRSCPARRGSCVIGNGVLAPVRKKSATTEPAMPRHNTQTNFRIENETYSKYSTTAIANVEAAKR